MDVFRYHVKTQCRYTNWSCEFSWLFLFLFVMKRKTLLAACVPAALGNFGSQRVPRGSTAAQVEGQGGQGGQAVFCARWLLGCSAGRLSAWNCTEIAYRCLHRSPARAAVWKWAKIQATRELHASSTSPDASPEVNTLLSEMLLPWKHKKCFWGAFTKKPHEANWKLLWRHKCVQWSIFSSVCFSTSSFCCWKQKRDPAAGGGPGLAMPSAARLRS